MVLVVVYSTRNLRGRLYLHFLLAQSHSVNQCHTCSLVGLRVLQKCSFEYGLIFWAVTVSSAIVRLRLRAHAMIMTTIPCSSSLLSGQWLIVD